MVETIVAGLFGGATGLLGSVISKVASYFELKQKIKLREVEFRHEMALAQLQVEARAAELEAEAEIAEQKTWGAARTASYSHDASYGRPSTWVATLLRLVRPTLTIMLIVLTAFVFFNAPNETQYHVAQQIIFLAGMAVSWWFGDRYKSNAKKADDS